MTFFTRLEQLAKDFRFGVRALRKTPTLTAIAVGSLALGIGGSTAMFSVVHGVILDPFPYKDADRLMSVRVQEPGRGSNGSYYSIDNFLEIVERNTVFEGVIASTLSDVTWTGSGDPQRLRGNHCTMNTFDVMGVQPTIGRTLAPSDAIAGAEPVTILGYKFWQRQFGGDPQVLGRKLTLNGKVRTVIGVMPQRFMWRGADVYLPAVFHRGQDVEGERNVHLLGRLRAGVTPVAAAAELHNIVADLSQQKPGDFPKNWRIRLLTFKETFPSGITEALWILFGAVGLLLLIACANVSNLLLSRMAVRQREISIRGAMGASRSRLIQQLLCESLVLGISGGALGIAAAYAGLQGIIAMVPPNTIPDEAKIALNLPVLLFTLGVSVAAAILFGMAPALHSSRDLAAPLKETGRGVSGSARQRVLRSLLVVAEVALALMLLVGASLMIRTLVSIQGGELGMQPDRILTVRIPFARDRYREAARRNAFLQDVAGRVTAIPGVAAVGVTAGVPPIFSWALNVEVVGDAEQLGRPTLLEQTNADFEKAFGLTLTQGRYFTKAEEFGRIHSAVVNETFARQYLSGRDALGRIVKLPGLGQRAELTDRTFEIVGVVKDRINRISTGETLPQVFIPYSVIAAADRLMVLTHTNPEGIERAVREQVYAVDRIQPVTEVKTFEALIGENVYSRPRFNLLLFTVFAGLGLVLALFGVYGVISNTVSQRTREIGIRLALGASFPQVIRMVLSLGIKLLGVGIAVGLIGSLASVRLLSSQVLNVSTFDPYSFAAVTIVILATGLFASYWPARRAARVDPVTALRDE